MFARPAPHPDREKRGPVKAGELFATRLAAEVAARPELADLRVVAAPGGWNWLIGGLDPDASTDDLLEAPDGFVGKDQRPEPIRPLLLDRVPPPDLPKLREPSLREPSTR
jgi:hypothetical protein